MANPPSVRITANFERNLAEIEQFLAQAEAPQAFNALLNELLETVIPNLERFPAIGRRFLHRAARSAEAANAIAVLQAKLAAVAAPSDPPLREYVMADDLVLYLQTDDALFLLSIKHHKQLSFDFEGHWGAT